MGVIHTRPGAAVQLTQQQRTTLKQHMAANTNTTPATAANGDVLTPPFVVNARLNTGNADDERAIAEWYNAPALGGDNQPFANLNIWNPRTTVQQLNTARQWGTPAAGADVPTQTLNELTYQSMIWNMFIDFSDPQVRAGILACFGNVSPGNAASIGAVGCGKVAGRRVELTVAGTPIGASAPAWTAAHPPAKLADGTQAVGGAALLSQPDVHDVLING